MQLQAKIVGDLIWSDPQTVLEILHQIQFHWFGTSQDKPLKLPWLQVGSSMQVTKEWWYNSCFYFCAR